MGGACFCNGGHFQEININMEFVTCSQDSVVFWDYKSFSSKRSAQPFSGSGYHVQSACWSASNSKLMVAPKWGDCISWCEPATDTSNWNTIWHRDSGHFTCGCLMSNSRYLLSGASDSLLALWDLKNKTSTKTFEGHTSPVTGVVSSSNDQLVLSGGQDGRLLLHSLSSSSSHTLLNTVTLSNTDTISPQGAITRLRFSVMDRALAASSSESGCVCLWSVESQRMLCQFSSQPQSGPTTDLCFAQSNNKLLVSVGQDCKIHFMDIQQRAQVMLVNTPSPLSSVAILRDGFTVAVGGVDGKLYVYELRAMKTPKHVLEAHCGAVTCIAEQNSVKSSRGSMKRGSSHSSRKSTKEQSVASDSPSTASSSSIGAPQDQHSPQHDPVASTTQGSVISPLVPADGSSEPPSHPPPLPTVHQIRPVAPHQTPYIAPRSTSVQWAQFTTPAQPASDKDSTGIFSPVDSTMSTPSIHPEITHPPPPSNDSNGTNKMVPQKPQSGGRPVLDTRGHPLMSTFVSSTPAMQKPPLGMSGIFSPLDAVTPAPLGAMGPAVGGWRPGLRSVPSVTPSAATPALSAVNLVRPPANAVVGEDSSSMTSLHTRHTLPTSNTPTAGTNSQTSQSPYSLTESGAGVSQQQQESLQQVPPHSHHDNHNASVDGLQTASLKASVIPTNGLSNAPPGHDEIPLPQASSVHLQHMEKLIRDSNEELRYATHRDIRALGMDMFRQFLMLQQQVGTAVSVLHDKIEKLSLENKHLREQLHQYAPKY